MKKLIPVLAMFCLFFPAQVLAEKVVFVTLENLPPKVYKENGQLTGTYVDIIYEVCKRLNIEPEFRLISWERAIRDVKVGDADAIFPPVFNEERAEFLYFPSEPMTTKKNIIFARKGSDIKAKGLGDLKDKIIGVNNYSYGANFDNYHGLTKQYYTDIKELVQILNIGRIDVAVAAEEPFRFFAKQLGFADKFEAVYTISEEASYVAFSKAAGKKGEQLADKFGQTLRQLKEEGVIRKIEDKYFK